MNFSAGTGPAAVRQATVAVSVIPEIIQDMVVSEPFFTSLFTDSTSEVSFRPYRLKVKIDGAVVSEWLESDKVKEGDRGHCHISTISLSST